MGRHSLSACITVADVVAVVDNGLCAVNEVSGGLPFRLGSIRGDRLGVGEVCFRDSFLVQACQYGIGNAGIRPLTVYVLRIDEAAADTWGDIDEVEFHDTRDGSPIFLIQILASALLGGNLKIDTRCESQFVMTACVVARTILYMFRFPVVVGLSGRFWLELAFRIVGGALRVEIDITGKGS